MRLEPVLEQAAYLQGPGGWVELPCLYDAPNGAEPGLYAMPTPGLGYKIGLDRSLRSFHAGDDDRSPDPGIDAEIAARVARDCASLVPTVLSSQVCSWTESPDGRFVLDVLHGGRVVLACGDSGEGFKFSALIGELLADWVEGVEPDHDAATFGLARFAERPSGGARPVLGG